MNSLNVFRVRSFLFVLGIMLCLASSAGAQSAGPAPQPGASLAAQSATPIKMDRDETSGAVSWLAGSFAAAAPGNPVESAYAFLEKNRAAFRVQSPRTDFAVISTKKGLLQPTEHVYLQQKVGDIPVWGRYLGFHYDQQGRLYAVNGKYGILARQKNLAAKPRLTAEKAFQAAWADAQRPPLRGTKAAADAQTGPVRLDADIPHTEQLMYFVDSLDALRLCYKVDLCVVNPTGTWVYFIDALSGAVLNKFNNAQAAGPAVGSGKDLYDQVVSLNTYQDADGKYKLIDASKAMYGNHATNHPMTAWQGCIEVRDAGHEDADATGMPPATERSPAVTDPDGDNVFTTSDTDPKNNLQPAVQLAAYLSAVYDFYRERCGRNSLDNRGLSMVGNMHWGKKFSNSMWYPPTQQMYFGDGGDDYWPETRSLDTVAHEATHGVTEFEIQGVGYTYQYESGAINESHSDIGAICNDYDEWLYGEEYHKDGSPSRRFDDPTAVASPQPKDMYDIFLWPTDIDGGGNHYNSGIGNHFFYNFSMLLPAAAPASDGRFTAFQVMYRSYVYGAANPSLTFREWAQYIKQAAVDLYGPGTVYDAAAAALNYVHMPQAMVSGYDNGHFKWGDDGNPWYLWMQRAGSPCWPVVSVRFTRPCANAKLKVAAINLENLDPWSKFRVWYFGCKADGSPDESDYHLLSDNNAPSVIKTNYLYNLFKLTNAMSVGSDFHIALDLYAGNYLGIRYDTGDPATGRSWFKYMVYSGGVWYYQWYQTKEFFAASPEIYPAGFDPTMLIKVIYEISPSNAPCAPTLAGPANGATLDNPVVTFSWNAASGADRYFLEANSSSDWSAATRAYFATVYGTSASVSGFPVGANYWRVWAGNADAWSAASETRSFTETAPPPQLAAGVSSLAQTATLGRNAAGQSFDVWNCGSGSLTYSAAADAAWLSVSPATGSSSGEHDTLQVSYSSSNLAEGAHTATITIASTNAYGSPLTIPVTLTVSRPIPVAGDFDGDRAADPAMFAGGNWYLWLSSGGYRRSGPYSLDDEGTIPSAVDFDGDGRADPAVADSSGNWYLRLSAYGYAAFGPAAFSESGCTPLAADFDGDRRADPAGADCSGNWYLWLSAYGYLRGGPYALGSSGLTPRAADFDGDGRADPAGVNSSGNWYIWFSSYGYMMGGPFAFGQSGLTPLAADFDGDGRADCASVDSSGNWYLWLSAHGYLRGGPYALGLPD